MLPTRNMSEPYHAVMPRRTHKLVIRQLRSPVLVARIIEQAAEQVVTLLFRLSVFARVDHLCHVALQSTEILSWSHVMRVNSRTLNSSNAILTFFSCSVRPRFSAHSGMRAF